MRIVSEPDASAADVGLIEDRINEFNMRVTGDRSWKPVRIFLRDAAGQIRGGITADLWGGWLDIQFLWVDEALREQHYGTQLIEAAENEAREFGCRHARVSTFSFQARPFYEGLGYTVVATFPDYPPGHSHYVLQKSLI